MLVESFTYIAAYLDSVFLKSLDGWVVIGLVGQVLFILRFGVQWIASERAGRSIIPVSFWYLSIGGAILLSIYAIYRRDPVFILGQGPNVLIYTRNLVLIQKEKKRSEISE